MLPKFSKSQDSLTRTTLIKMGIRIGVVIITVTLLSYWHVISNLELQVVEQLSKYITERGERESNIFILAKDNHAILKKEFERRLQLLGDKDPQERFEQLFVKWSDGITRTRPKDQQPEQFDTRQYPGLHVGAQANINADVRRRIVTFYDLLKSYGPAWHNRFVNTYMMTPEGIITIYWPGETWTQNADADLNILNEEYFYISDKKHNPDRKPAWTGLYFDHVVKIWMVSLETPVDDVKGRHLATIGHDIVLNELMARTLSDQLKGTYNIIFRKDGRLIAHPKKMDEIKEKGGQFNILQSGDQHLIDIFQQVQTLKQEEVVIDNNHGNEYLAITKIEGPDWYFVTVYPKSLLADLAFDTASFILILGILSLIIELFVLLIVLHRQVTRPLQKFLGVTQEIAAGNFSTETIHQHLPLNRSDEIGQLAQSFNGMAGQLKTSFDTLDAKVIDRTAQLNDKVEELTQTRQELVHSEKMAALGQLVAGIAHEVNTPLGAIRSSAETLSTGLKQTLDQFPKLLEMLTPEQKDEFYALLENSLESKVILSVKEKRAAKKAITAALKKLDLEKVRVLTDTFISLGIYADAERYLSLLTHPNSDLIFKNAYQLSTLTRSTGNILNAVNKASKVIFALKTFARYDMSGEKSSSNLVEGLEAVLTLYHNQMKHGIELVTEYAEIPAIPCYPDELNQVWTNLVHNAIQAMDNKGTLKLAISQRDNYVIVSISDSGPGIPEDIKDQIFTPFFTTKPAGEGSGLGLDIVKKIVDKHDGKIEVESEVGKGTSFSIFLPLS